MLPFLASMFFSMAILVFLHFKGLFICPIFTDERITAKAHLLSLKNDEKLSLWRRFWTVYRVLTIFLMLSISLPFIINVICRIKIENACIPPTPSNVVGSYILSAIFMALSVWLLVLSIKLKSNKPFDNSYRRESGIERWIRNTASPPFNLPERGFCL